MPYETINIIVKDHHPKGTGTGTAAEQPDPRKEFREYQKERYAAHSEEARNYAELAFRTSERYDQWVLMLAGGALGISITFIEKIAPHPHWYLLLGLAWLCYVLALIFGFLAINCSRDAIYRQLSLADKAYTHWLTTATADEPAGTKTEDEDNEFNRRLDILNRVSLLGVALGTLLLCAFAFVNLWASSHADTTGVDHQAAKAPELRQPAQQTTTNKTNEQPVDQRQPKTNAPVI
jgi:hypothetical protein